MPQTDVIHRIYVGEPTDKILLQIEGNIGKTTVANPTTGRVGATETCCSCACGSCSCNCSCNACGSCYCACSCCGVADVYVDDLLKKIELTNQRIGQMHDILRSIQSGTKLQ